MSVLIDKLFIVWILSFPFYHFSIIGSLSLDNMIGLVLLALWPIWFVMQSPKPGEEYLKNIFVSAVIVGVYFIVHTIMLVNTSNAVWLSAYTVATNLVYFILPVIYISNWKRIKAIDETIIIITLVGSLSAFLASIGIIHLEVSRFAQSRIDIEGLQKTVGLFGVYGDMAILMSFSILTVMESRSTKKLFGKRTKLKASAIYIIIILGLLGSQSRNILFSIVVALVAYFVIKKMQSAWKNWPRKFYPLVITGIIFTVIILTMLWQPLLDFIISISGTNEAAGTIEARLGQYKFGLNLVENHLMFGADPAIQEKMFHEIAYIHNMWLKELVQGGIAAIMSVLLIYLYAIKHMTRNMVINPYDFASRVRLVLVIVMIVSTQFNPAGTAVYWMMFGLIYAHAYVEPHMSDELDKAVPQKNEDDGYRILKRRRGGSRLATRINSEIK